MLVLFDDSQFGAVVADDTSEQLTANPLAVCDTVIADGSDARLLVPLHETPIESHQPDGTIRCAPGCSLPLDLFVSDTVRVARDGGAYDLFDFDVWYGGGSLARERWREAPPVAEVQEDEREIALDGMLTRSAPGGE